MVNTHGYQHTTFGASKFTVIFRAYLHIDELKMIVGLDGREAINVFAITSSWNKDIFRGLATHPWEKNVYTIMGKYFGIFTYQKQSELFR